jgi:hypothetical protein
MNDASEEDIARSSDMEAMRLLAQKFATKSSRARPVRVERKEKEKKARTMVDGRSLRAKGRSAQVNIKVRPEIREHLLKFAETEGVLIADWFEQLVEGLPVRGA